MFTTENTQQTMNQQTSQTQFSANRDQFAEKELNYLKDFMSWELLAMKKCAAMAQMCSDTHVKDLLIATGQAHEKHYRTLLQQLN